MGLGVLRMSPEFAPRAAFPRSVPAGVGSGTCLLILPPASSLSSRPSLAPVLTAFPPVPALLVSWVGKPASPLREEEVAVAVKHVAVASPEASVLFSLCAFILPRPEDAPALPQGPGGFHT